MKAPALSGLGARAMFEDLKGNRRVQGALVLLAGLVWYLWPSAPAARRPATSRPASPLSDRQTAELERLPDLAKLDQAGALPGDAHLLRDLFMFEGPAIPVKPPPPPPPPPTPEQLAAQALAQERARQSASRPQVRYLGYLDSPGSGRLGAFMKGEEPVTWKQGALVTPQWRLVTLEPAWAEFRNERFADLRQRVEAVDARGAAGSSRAQENEF